MFLLSGLPSSRNYFFSGFLFYLFSVHAAILIRILFVLRMFYSDSSYKGTPVLLSSSFMSHLLMDVVLMPLTIFFPPLFELAGFS